MGDAQVRGGVIFSKFPSNINKHRLNSIQGQKGQIMSYIRNKYVDLLKEEYCTIWVTLVKNN